MFVVVVFFLIYGVEVFFKVRGGFTMQRIPQIINSRRSPVRSRQRRRLPQQQLHLPEGEERKPMMEPKLCGLVPQVMMIMMLMMI